MKNTVLLVIIIGAIFNVAGCIKAKNDFAQFQAYQNSLGGFVEGFARGASGASHGDYFGPALNILDQARELENAKNNRRFWAWVWSGSAVLILIATRGKSQPPSR